MNIENLSILDVADRLGMAYSQRGAWRKALCFIHEDHHPSLGLCVARRRWRCFSCGKGGGILDLVMQHENLSRSEALEWLAREFRIDLPQREPRQSIIQSFNQKTMTTETVNDIPQELIETFRGSSNEFTRALVQGGILSPAQMRHAAEVFRLSTVDDGVIFWQIDAELHIREGKVMYYQADAHRSHSRKPVTVSWLLKQGGKLPEWWSATPCLFGLHQVHGNAESPVAVVESEKTAVICSELLGSEHFVWMATGGKCNLSVSMLQPLRGRRIIVFPDTDPTGETYREWLRIAQDAAKVLGHPITVSDLLERHATPEQKQRKIDIADLIIESPPTPEGGGRPDK